MTEWQKKEIARYDAALAEARRFVFKAEAALVEIREDDYSHKHRAAAKRASMDLTRSLAIMRKSPYA